jgi:hypothetical protein
MLILYQSRVHFKWHEAFKHGHFFDIGNINEQLLQEISDEVQNVAQESSIEHVSPPPKKNLINCNPTNILHILPLSLIHFILSEHLHTLYLCPPANSSQFLLLYPPALSTTPRNGLPHHSITFLDFTIT